MTKWRLEGYSTDRRSEDVRFRAYTTSQRKAEAFRKIPKIQFTDSGHGIVFSAFKEENGVTLPRVYTLADYVTAELRKIARGKS